jgi:uncharacterized alkaline shock family protein YloU
MDSIKHYENNRYVGKTSFRDGLLTSLIVLSIKDVDGVAFLTERIQKHCFCRRHGVLVNFDFDGINFDITIGVKFGYSAADVCYRVQEAVMDVAAPLVEGKIKNVNIKIAGVTNGKKPEPGFFLLKKAKRA